VRVLVLGCGYAGSAVARLAREHGHEVIANVRSEQRAAALAAQGFRVDRRAALDASIGELADANTHVVVAFPPDGVTDARIAPALANARAVTYLSTTGIYGDVRGVVDDATPVPEPTERSAAVLAAETDYRARGAVVLRCPALYGPDRGLHVRILRGQHSIPGDGTRHLSRIHIADLARFVLGCAPVRGETFVVGDDDPARHIDVVRFVCETYGVTMPPFVPLESVHPSLRADRRVEATRARRALGVTLSYPSYREGMARSATGL